MIIQTNSQIYLIELLPGKERFMNSILHSRRSSVIITHPVWTDEIEIIFVTSEHHLGLDLIHMQ